jgi:hypothetical protein
MYDDGNWNQFHCGKNWSIELSSICWLKRYECLCYVGIQMTTRNEKTKTIIWETIEWNEEKKEGKMSLWGNEEHIAGIFMPTQMIQYCLRQL